MIRDGYVNEVADDMEYVVDTEPKPVTIIVTVSGGLVQDVHGAPGHIVVDWDEVEQNYEHAEHLIDVLESIKPEAIPEGYDLSSVLEELRAARGTT